MLRIAEYTIDSSGIEQVATKEEMDQLQAYLYHRGIAKLRKNDLSLAIQRLKPREAIVMGDFKANLVLGRAEVSTDKEFFESPECSVFGVVVVYKKPNGNHTSFLIISAGC